MRRTALRIGAELIPLLLVFGSLAVALGLIVQAHRRAMVPKAVKAPEPVAIAPSLESKPAPPPSVILPPDPDPEPKPKPKPDPEPEPADPTPAALAEIRTNVDEQNAEAAKSDAEAKRLDAARNALVKRTGGWKRRQMLAKDQLDRVDQAVTTLEQQADVLAQLRDVLAAKRDREKAELAVAQSRSGVAILPYKGVNGTWRLPVVIECRNGTATLQPNGPSFSLVELSGVFSARSSPIARAVALRLLQLQGVESPDGQAVVPYLLFVIRPDGIRPYYEARSRLEPLGISFGYELVDADADIDFPDLADPSEWSDTPGKKKPERLAGEFVWPAERLGAGGNARKEKEKGSEFVWPTTETYGAGDFHDPGQPGRAPFDPSTDREIVPYGNPKPSRDSMLSSGGPGALPNRYGYDRGGAYPGGTGFDPKPRKPGRVELTPEDLLAAIEEEYNGPPTAETGFDPLSEPEAPAPLALHPNQVGRNPVRSPFLESSGPAPFASEAQGENGIAGRPSGGYPAAPSRSIPGSPTDRAGTGRGREARPSAGTGDRPAPTIGGYGAAFSPAEGVPSGLSGTNANRSGGVPSLAGSGGEQGQGTQGSASPGLVNMSLTGGGEASSPGSETAGNALGDQAGSSASSEAYRKRRNLEMVIACGPGGVTVHPGGYRISPASLDADKGMLDKVLHGIVRNHQNKDPKSQWMPRLKYLVEPGGQMTYQKAREQTVTGASGWPAYLKVSEGSPLKIAVGEKNTR
jgi:hypothetical protein